MRTGDLGTCDLVATGDALGEFSEHYTGHRVGYYFESLVYYWLKHERKVEFLAKGLQIQEEGGGRTIGELDFVFRDTDGRVCHWEVAAKFYLFCADHQVRGSHFIGPNAADTYERKRDKLMVQQLPLSGSVFPEVTDRVPFVKGRIFYHPRQPRPQGLPQGLEREHLTGIWLRQSDLGWLKSEGTKREWRYRLVEKPFWLAPCTLTEADESPVDIPELDQLLEQHFAEKTQPVLISALQRENQRWVEDERLFVVANEWPAM